ncbi:class F sortase [Streptomyces sp. NPDC006372]|uniref:class F sortase n=1 Tax=Streptomyces sp. NPDC006372 TaxID=3155599 RepID=UPI0033BC9A75
MGCLLLVCGLFWDRGEEPGGHSVVALSDDSRTDTAGRPGADVTRSPRPAPTREPASNPTRAPAPRPRTATHPTPRSDKPGARSKGPATVRPGAEPTRTSLRPLPPSRATRLLIPYLRLDAPVMGLGLDRDRRLTAPPEDDPKLVGWYENGASPGGQGTAVAVGHLDTDRGPAVFAGLTELEPGRLVKVRRADGRTAVYTVDAIRSYEKAHFPSQEVYGARSRPELRLITCGGNYDRRKGYSGNLVVFAHLTGTR